MNSVTEPFRQSPRWKRVVLLTALGAACGLAGGYGIGLVIKASGHARAVGWSDALSLTVAGILFIGGAAVLIATTSRSGASFLEAPHAEDRDHTLRPGQITYLRLQGGVLVLAGVLMAAPELARLLFPNLVPSLAAGILAALVVGFGLQSALNLQVWRRSDELLRRMISEGAAASFWLLQGLLFLWAAGERLNLLPHLHSWDAFTFVMAAYLLASSLVAHRRGLG